MMTSTSHAVTRNCVAIVYLLCARQGQWRRNATVPWQRELPALALGAARHGRLAMVQCLITNDDQEAIDWRMILFKAARVRAAPIVKWVVASQPVIDVQTLQPTLYQASAVAFALETPDARDFARDCAPPSTNVLPSHIVSFGSRDDQRTKCV
ncbi:Aste57867_18921 [Aphanomyces stellatus]|uniref:Aste57867_18921 protein n=1 Tax=Aphanomyces stellatus TaxID=120398 RepID=A0A485LBJ7_9STRA|nr:hypothetical protein As57867_018857 [Aphanomyces stellatus]VFT95653.1 Aste57867_18921 [Aphanomyces stellatus]